MNTQQPPQWKPKPDAPGFWILQRENDLAELLGAKFAILEIKPATIERPPSSKYCVRAYGPIPTEEESTNAPYLRISQLDELQSQIQANSELIDRHTEQIRVLEEDARQADKKILANAGTIARILLAIGDQSKTPSERLAQQFFQQINEQTEQELKQQKSSLEKRIENFLDKNLPK